MTTTVATDSSVTNEQEKTKDTLSASENQENVVAEKDDAVDRPLPKSTTNEEHPLQNRWAFWFLKGDRTKDWVDCLRMVAEFDTVEQFWAMYNHTLPASTLGWGSDYYLFKSGIQPMWEDPRNINGGRWLASVEKNQRGTKLDQYWLELLMAMVGEQFEDNDEMVCGAAVNIRQKGDKVALWTRSAKDSDDDQNHRIGQLMKDKLGAGEMQYIVHKDSSAKRGSTVRPKMFIHS